MTTFYGDTETFCETPLAHGLHRYAEKVEITVFAWALDEGPVEVCTLVRRSAVSPVCEPAGLTPAAPCARSTTSHAARPRWTARASGVRLPNEPDGVRH